MPKNQKELTTAEKYRINSAVKNIQKVPTEEEKYKVWSDRVYEENYKSGKIFRHNVKSVDEFMAEINAGRTGITDNGGYKKKKDK